MNSKHKIIQWNRTSKRIGKEAPRLLLEMSPLSLMVMTAMTVYENNMRDFREKKTKRYYSHYESFELFVRRPGFACRIDKIIDSLSLI